MPKSKTILKRTLFGMRQFITEEKIKRAILNQTKKDKDIIYGAQSIHKQIGSAIARPTIDYDIFTRKPKKSAQKIEKRLDKISGRDYYYIKKGKNIGTWKVKNRGRDLRKGTKDDVGIVDYTKIPTPKPKYKIINGIKYRVLKQEIKAKRKAIKDPAFKFRKEKDTEDLGRIGFFLPISLKF